MHLRNFDLNLLVVLDALLSGRNVTRAAEMLCVTQPAVSNALQRIRAYFDDQILVRRGREMELTPFAQDLIGPVRELMLSAGRVLDADYQFDPAGTTRRFRLAMSDYCAAVLMGPLLNLLVSEAPHMQCDVVGLSEKTVAMLMGGEVDFCLTAQDLRMLDVSTDPEQFERRTLFRDDFVCAVDAGNDQVGEELDLQTYLFLPHATTRFGNRQLLMEEISLQRLDIKVRIAAVLPTFVGLATLIEDTPLVTCLQRRLAQRMAPQSRLRFFEPPIPILELEETIYWHPRLQHDKAHQWLREQLAAVAARLPDAAARHGYAGGAAVF